MFERKKTYLDYEGRALPYPWRYNWMLLLAGGMNMLRLRFGSRNPRQAAEKTLRDILTISRNTVYGREHHFDRILSATSTEGL